MAQQEKKLRFDLKGWNSSYGKFFSEEAALKFYRVSYEDDIPAKELKKHLSSLEDWEQYAYEKKILIENTAVIEPTDQPYASICLNEGNVIVRFLDEHNRIYMYYTFGGEYKEGQVFLERLHYFIYPDDEKFYRRGDSIKDVMYDFTPEGKLTVTTEELRADGERYQVIEEAAHPVNVSANWEPYPELGKYESIARLKRWGDGDLLKGIDPSKPAPPSPAGKPKEGTDPYSKWLPDNWDEVLGNKN